MIRTFMRSRARDRRTNVGEESVEHRLVVTRTGSTFGVVLVGADRQRAMREALDRAIVEVARAHVEVAAAGDRGFVDLELVVLAVMSEGQARRRGSDGAPDQLMTKTDAQDRHGPRGAALRYRVEEQLHV